MIDRTKKLSTGAVLLGVLLFGLVGFLPVLAQPSQPGAATPASVTIGYVELARDARYDPDRAYTRDPLRALGRPFPAAEVAIAEAAPVSSVMGIQFLLKHEVAANLDEAEQWVHQQIAEDNLHFIVADLPESALLKLSQYLQQQLVLIFNTTVASDALRGKECRANLLHTLPSAAMLADALVQYLVSKKWRSILALAGPTPKDKADLAALTRSAKRFGAHLAAVRSFLPGADPRRREQNNPLLLTSGVDYDVVDVIDGDGDFARALPFAIARPRPVVGSAGLVATAWHWSWDSHGAPQLNSRFEQHAHRRMDQYDWATWAAVKAVVQASLRTRGGAFAQLRSYLLGDALNLDGYKGNPMSFRAWDHQLRQPVLLAASNAIVARAPIAGFLHSINELDTVGVDQPETQCAFHAQAAH